jgi:hypothetical protein
MEDLTIKLRITEGLYNKIESFREFELFEQTAVRVLETGIDVMVENRVKEQIEQEINFII